MGQEFADVSTLPGECLVQLRCATLPSLCRIVAVHHWFVVFDPAAQRWHRWEVWQRREAGGTSWGHVHQDLMHPDRGVGGGPCVILAEWRGDAAAAISAVLADPCGYPHCQRYRYWPGPNSNTYAAWMLRQAGIAPDMDPRGVGKDFLGVRESRVERTGTGICVRTPLVGIKADLRAGAELHLLGLTFGIDARPFAIKTPFGRLSLPSNE